MIMHRDSGAFVKLYMDEDREHRDITLDYPGFSPSFYRALQVAKEAGFQMVEFDSDAQVYELLEWHEW